MLQPSRFAETNPAATSMVARVGSGARPFRELDQRADDFICREFSIQRPR
jgi:hypothetical protein